MKRTAIALLLALFLAQAAFGEDRGVLLEINVFQGFRARITARPRSGRLPA
jgi:hypothetical protein